MSRAGILALVAVASAGPAGGACVAGDAATGDVDLALPPHFPRPIVPADNPLTPARIELGRYLFYDARLSVTGAVSCSSCHQQRFAFADDRPVSLGATGAAGVLNAPTLTNAAYNSPLTWAHPAVTEIEDQLLGPMFGVDPIEMGIAGAEDAILAQLRADPLYADLFAAAFDDSTGAAIGATELIDFDHVRYALASFVRTLLSHDAPFDGFVLGDTAAISDSARRGSELFYSSRLGCGGCHSGFAFTAAARSQASTGTQRSPYHNIGLYNVDGEGGYPDPAVGLIAETGVARDMGRFRVPTLRNLAFTAPYMHDGSVATLEEVIAIYEAGGRNVEDGPYAGDGRASPWRSAQLPSFELTDAERADLVEFLLSLSDDGFVTDPRLANPW